MTAEALRKWLETKGYDYEDLKSKFAGDNQQSRIKDFLIKDGLSKGRSHLQVYKSTIYAIDEAYKQDVVNEIAQRNADYRYDISIQIKNAGDINQINQISIDEEYEKENVNYLKRYSGKRRSDFEMKEKYLEQARSLTPETLEDWGLTERSTSKTIASRFSIPIEEAEQIYSKLTLAKRLEIPTKEAGEIYERYM